MTTSTALAASRSGPAAPLPLVARITRFVLIWTIAAAIFEGLVPQRPGRRVR